MFKQVFRFLELYDAVQILYTCRANARLRNYMYKKIQHATINNVDYLKQLVLHCRNIKSLACNIPYLGEVKYLIEHFQLETLNMYAHTIGSTDIDEVCMPSLKKIIASEAVIGRTINTILHIEELYICSRIEDFSSYGLPEAHFKNLKSIRWINFLDGAKCYCRPYAPITDLYISELTDSQTSLVNTYPLHTLRITSLLHNLSLMPGNIRHLSVQTDMMVNINCIEHFRLKSLELDFGQRRTIDFELPSTITHLTLMNCEFSFAILRRLKLERLELARCSFEYDGFAYIENQPIASLALNENNANPLYLERLPLTTVDLKSCNMDLSRLGRLKYVTIDTSKVKLSSNITHLSIINIVIDNLIPIIKIMPLEKLLVTACKLTDDKLAELSHLDLSCLELHDGVSIRALDLISHMTLRRVILPEFTPTEVFHFYKNKKRSKYPFTLG